MSSTVLAFFCLIGRKNKRTFGWTQKYFLCPIREKLIRMSHGTGLLRVASRVLPLGLQALSSAEAPAGYPYKNSNNRKNKKRARDIVRRVLSFSFSPAFPQFKAASAEERGLQGCVAFGLLRYIYFECKSGYFFRVCT